MARGTWVGSWRLDHVLGEGSFGRVWSCRDDAGRRAAAKVLHPHASAEAVARIRREAEVLSRLDHPAIPGVLDVFEHDGRPVLVVEEISGTPCTTAVGGDAERARLVLWSLCDAVAHAHARGVAHRDLKPEHVWVDGRGGVHILDFGAAGLDTSETLTLDVHPTTPLYAPPEWFAGVPEGVGSDAYAVGQMAWELCAGRPAYGASSLMALAEAKRQLPPMDGLPPDIAELVAGLMAADARWTVAQAQGHLAAPPAMEVEFATGSFSTSDATWGGEAAVESAPVSDGQRVGRYEVVRELGRGGNGVVFEAWDPELSRRVAVKLLVSGRFAHPQQEQRFLVEARAVARLTHPDIVPVLDLGRTQDGPYFAMAFVDGPSLSTWVETHGIPSLEQTLTWTTTVARALHHAHAAGIVHRDIKPGNIMLEEGDSPKLVDFGLAMGLEEEEAQLTREGQILGTPRYMAPEQARGRRADLGPTVDIYGLGVMLYELICGQPPFAGETPFEVLAAVLDGRHPSLESMAPELDPGLYRVVAKAMAHAPEDRYDSALELAEDLERLQTGEPVRAMSPSRWRVMRWWLQRHRIPLAAAAGVVVALSALVVGYRGVTTVLETRAQELRESDAAAAWSVADERARSLRSGGRFAEADAVVEAFFASPEFGSTDVSAEMHRQHAQRVTMAGDAEAAKAAWARALASARTVEQQGQALLGLARLFTSKLDLAGMHAALTVLEEVTPAMAASEEAQRLRKTLELALRSWTLTEEATALERALSVGMPIGGPASPFMQADLDGDDEDELYLERRDMLQGLRGAEDVSMPMACRAEVVSLVGPDLLICRQTPHYMILEAGGMRVYDWPHGRVQTTLTADLDGDGHPRAWITQGSGLYALERDADGQILLTLDDAVTAATDSNINGIDVGDLDGDGQMELITNPGEWWAYDVRVLSGVPLELKARRKLGHTSSVNFVRTERGPRLAAMHTDNYPNRRVFPPGQEHGSAGGLYLLRYDGSSLELEDHLAIWGREVAEGAKASTMDLDGDGFDEIVLSQSGGLVVYHQEAGRWAGIPMAGVQLLGDHDIDEDGDDELLVALDGDAWWVGAGDSPIPPFALGVAERSPPPEQMVEGRRGAWTRAERYGSLGLFELAATTLSDAALVESDRHLLARLHRREAEFLQLAGHGDRAAQTYARAWADVAPEAGEITSAAELLAQAGDRRAELELLDSVGTDLPPSIADEVRKRRARLDILTRPPSVDLGFNAPLPPAWSVESLWSVRRDPVRSVLHVDGLMPQGLLSRPVVWEGGSFVVELVIDEADVGWGSVLQLGLCPEGGSADRMWGLELRGRGGGGLYFVDVVGRMGDRRIGALRGDVTAFPWRIQYEYWPADQAGTLHLTDAHGAESRLLSPMTQRDDPRAEELAGEWSLRARFVGEEHSRLTAALRHVSVRGVSAPSLPETAPAVADLLAEGEDAASIARTPEERVQVAIERGDLVQPVTPEQRAHLLRTRPSRWTREIGRQLGVDMIDVLWDAWGGRLALDALTPADVLLVDELDVLMDLQPPARSTSELRLLHLLGARSRAALDLGRVRMTVASLARVEELVEQRPHLRATLPYVRAQIVGARLAVARGTVEEAAAHLQMGLRHAPSAAVFADLVLAAPELGAIRNHSVWQEVRRAHQGG